jgi:hypothetical protein
LVTTSATFIRDADFRSATFADHARFAGAEKRWSKETARLKAEVYEEKRGNVDLVQWERFSGFGIKFHRVFSDTSSLNLQLSEAKNPNMFRSTQSACALIGL